MSNRINPFPVNFSITSNNCYGLEKPSGSGSQISGGFTEAAGRIADIEALNGATKGLDILQKTAAAGGPNLTRIIDGGANAVIGTVLAPSGITGEQVFGTINRVQPSAVNSMVGAASQISDKLKDGSFSTDDIPVFTRDFANVIKIGGRLLSTPQERQGVEVCYAKPYAMDLMNFGVKLNYRFLVQFEFNSPYNQSMGGLDHKFMIKTADRPQVQFEYEDVNMYNFKTKVIRKAAYQPINLTFYDDQHAQVIDFYQMYLKTLSPIANIDPNESMRYEEMGLDFNRNLKQVVAGKTKSLSHGAYDYSASIGPLLQNNKDVIKAVRLVHLYYGGARMDVYTLINPRVMEMQLDQLDASASEANTLTMNLSYDGLYVETFKSTDDGVTSDLINKGAHHELLFQTEDRLMVLNSTNPEVRSGGIDEQEQNPDENVRQGGGIGGILKKASDFVTGTTSIF